MIRIDQITIDATEYQKLNEVEQQDYMMLFSPVGLRYIKKIAVENAIRK